MKTFTALREELSEQAHIIKSNTAWGIIHPEGIMSGLSHPTAKCHSELSDASGHDEADTVDYFKDSNGTMNIRTFSNESVKLAIKHFNSLPHGREGNVIHDHFNQSDDGGESTYHGSIEGKRHHVLSKLKALDKAG